MTSPSGRRGLGATEDVRAGAHPRGVWAPRAEGAARTTVPTRPRSRRRIAPHEPADVVAVGARERLAFDEEDVLRVRLGVLREIVAPGDHGVVHDDHFVMHV